MLPQFPVPREIEGPSRLIYFAGFLGIEILDLSTQSNCLRLHFRIGYQIDAARHHLLNGFSYDDGSVSPHQSRRLFPSVWLSMALG